MAIACSCQEQWTCALLLHTESVTPCAAARRMAVTDVSSNFSATNNRLLSFEYIMSASSAAMQTVQLLRVQPNWWLAACRVGSCAQTVCAVWLVDELHYKQLRTISFAYGPVLVSRSTAADAAVALYVTRCIVCMYESL